MWARAGAVVVGTRVVFMLLAYAASYFLSAETEGTPERGLLDIWVHWDASRFLTIAEHGYDGPNSTPNGTAFFPLFPLTIRALTAAGFNGIVAGLLISAVASWVALAYLYRLADMAEPGTGRSAILYLALWPTAVFLIAPYSESLFLAGAIAAFYYAKCSSWHLVGIPAAVAMGSRFAGVFLLAGLAVEFLAQRDFTSKRVANAGLSLVIGLLPLLAYAAFLSQIRGDPFYFFVDQQQGWGRSFTDPLSAWTTSVDRLDLAASGNMMAAYRFEIAAALVGLGLVAWAAVRREWAYAIYMGLLLAALATSTEYMSIPRILLTCFPAALLIAHATHGNKTAHEIYLAATTVTMGLGVVVYTRGAWFF